MTRKTFRERKDVRPTDKGEQKILFGGSPLGPLNTKQYFSFRRRLVALDFDLEVGIIGGSGLDDPEILDGRKEIYLETPYGEAKWFSLDCIRLIFQ